MYQLPDGTWYIPAVNGCRCVYSWQNWPVPSGPHQDTTNCPVHDVGDVLAREIEGFLAKQA